MDDTMMRVCRLVVAGVAVSFGPRTSMGDDPSATGPTTTQRSRAADASTPDDDLIRKLLQRASGEGDDEEVLQRIMRLMEASHVRLAGQFDPGEQTQRIKRRILEDLDEALKRSRNRPPQSKRSQQQRSDDRRQRGRRQPTKNPASQPSKSKAQQDKDAGQAKSRDAGHGRRGDARNATSRRAPRDTGRQWGNLPSRDREAVLQGIKDDYLPKFKEMIERYYKALAK